ncbi:MAG TPA: DUF3306 domain-containing protein, partial [Ramlibacter sp.]|nr:DUF3306 domain-containing protein [Ramlibacter sp.]
MSDGFLGRWSKRKLEVKEGKAVEPEPLPTVAPVPVAAAAPLPATPETALEASPETPLPTLEDVKSLTAESDFSRF